MGDRINEDAEDGDGEGQAFGKLVILKRGRPKAYLGNKEDGAEDRRLGGEDCREDLQECRDRSRPVGGEGAQKSRCREKQHDVVAGLEADKSGSGREEADEGGKKMHDDLVLDHDRDKFDRRWFVKLFCRRIL